MTRDSNGRVTAVDSAVLADPELSTLSPTTQKYDEKTIYGYDALDRQSAVTEYVRTSGAVTQSRLTTYGYDPITGAVALVDSSEGKVHHKYDSVTGQLIETWTGDTNDPSDPLHPATTDMLFGYDQLGRLKSVSSAKINGGIPAAPAVQHSRFDATGQIVADNMLPTTTYDYDAAGNLDHINLPNGVVEDYDYNDLDRLTKLTTTNGGGFKLFQQDYTLLSNGQRDDVVEQRFDGASTAPFSTVKIDWSYDGLGRLTTEVRDVGNNGPDSADYRHDFAYDLAGNRLSEKIDLGNDNVNAPDETVNYTYDDRDRLSNGNSDNNANDVAYTYDPNGSMTQKVTGPTGGSQVTVRYLRDLRNRLTAVDGNGDDLSISGGVTSGIVNDSSDATYGYDEQGQRISEKVSNASSTRYYLNDKENPTGYPQIIEERLGTSPASAAFDRSYILGMTVLGQYDATNGVLYLLKDGHGSTRALANPSGPIGSGDMFDYQGFGEAIGFTPATAKTIDLFGGDAEYDPTSNFYYHDKRWRQDYRFISMDDYAGDTGEPLTLHKYTYTGNDPIDRQDQNGNEFSLIAIMVGSGIATALQAFYNEGVHAGGEYVKLSFLISYATWGSSVAAALQFAGADFDFEANYAETANAVLSGNRSIASLSRDGGEIRGHPVVCKYVKSVDRSERDSGHQLEDGLPELASALVAKLYDRRA